MPPAMATELFGAFAEPVEGGQEKSPIRVRPLGGPGNPFLDDHFESQVKPDPADVYEQPPVNFAAMFAADPGPDEPSQWSPGGAIKFPQPLPHLRWDGAPSNKGVKPEQMEKAARCNKAYEDTLAETADSWNAAAPYIGQFHSAARKAQDLGLLGEAGAAFDRPSDANANLDRYGDGQKVGPTSRSQELKSLFDAKGNLTNLATNKVVKDQDALDKPQDAAFGEAARAVGRACDTLDANLVSQKNCAIKIKSALLKVELAQRGNDVVNGVEKSRQLNDDKQRWSLAIDSTTKILSGALDAFAAAKKGDAAAAAKGVISSYGTFGKWVSDRDFDQEILAADRQVYAIQRDLAGLQGQIAATELETAINDYEANKKQIQIARSLVVTANTNRRLAFNAFGQAAGLQAKKGGASEEEAARVEASVKAIPVVEEVLMRIQKVTKAIKTPTYTEDAGIGYRAAGQNPSFAKHFGWLSGYWAQFREHELKWQLRFDALSAMAKAMHSKGG